MTLTEALTILKNQPAEGASFDVLLACGHTPLHLEKFLGAQLQTGLPDRRVSIRTGLFGDLAGSLEAISQGPRPHAVAVAIEWADLDPRLGYRQLGGWGPQQEADYAATVRRSCERIRNAIERITDTPVAVSLPTLPLPPAFHTAGWQAGAEHWDVEWALSDFARALAASPQVRIGNREFLKGLHTGPAHDLKTELLAGMPHRVEHASAVAQMLAWLLQPPTPKKGLITDLDDTLWHGLVGEVGPEGVSWDLSSHQQSHGLYQQVLRALAESGVLVGVASKNDPEVVARALRRDDLLMPASRMFPVEAHWNAKSGSVRNILRTWNIAADAVVFIDDSPMELAEVAAAHPGITCIEFPRGNPEQVLQVFRQLRDLFGKSRITEEDTYRLESIQRAAEFQEASSESGTASEELLAGLGSAITLDLQWGAAATRPADPRVLELVNKTNQFNLNGERRSEADWQQSCARPGAFLMVVSYQDKFGPLGKIAVLQGRVVGRELHVETWVMSCRAFARRIEHRSLAVLLEQSGAEVALLRYTPTNRNGPVRDFLKQVLESEPGPEGVRIERAGFERRLPSLYHSVAIKKPAEEQVYG